jgi:hypothetical protein
MRKVKKMTKDAKKLLKNQSLDFARQVTSLRVRHAGVTIRMDLPRKKKASGSQVKLTEGFGKRLAGI